jgi:acyl-CoA hydrolase
MVTSFVIGSERVYDFVDDNPFVEFHPCDHTNDTARIRKNDHAVAINSALEIDLSGQVCADSIGFRIYSGIGGQMDNTTFHLWSKMTNWIMENMGNANTKAPLNAPKKPRAF